jgi:hypothetical protein
MTSAYVVVAKDSGGAVSEAGFDTTPWWLVSNEPPANWIMSYTFD